MLLLASIHFISIHFAIILSLSLLFFGSGIFDMNIPQTVSSWFRSSSCFSQTHTHIANVFYSPHFNTYIHLHFAFVFIMNCILFSLIFNHTLAMRQCMMMKCNQNWYVVWFLPAGYQNECMQSIYTWWRWTLSFVKHDLLAKTTSIQLYTFSLSLHCITFIFLLCE